MKQAIHTMKLHHSPFQMIKSGEKTIELRLLDKKTVADQRRRRDRFYQHDHRRNPQQNSQEIAPLPKFQ